MRSAKFFDGLFRLALYGQIVRRQMTKRAVWLMALGVVERGELVRVQTLRYIDVR